MQPQQRRPGDPNDEDTRVIQTPFSKGGDSGGPPIYQMKNTHTTPSEWRGAMLLAAAVAAYVLLGRAQPGAASASLVKWSVVALAVTFGWGVIVMCVEKSRTLLVFQLMSALAVVGLDSVYWIRLALH